MTTRKQSDERLLKLAWLLENLPEEIPKMKFPKPPKDIRFDLELWFDCGTQACAIGFAACHPWFNQRHFKFDVSIDPVFDGDWGFHAVNPFFGISSTAGHRLFVNDSYKRGNRRDVATRIRAFVRNR